MDFNQILPYLPFIFAGLFALVMLGSVLFALGRGLSKARIRLIILAVCLLLAFVITWAVKSGAGSVYPQLETTLKQAITSEQAMEFYKLFSESEPLQETLVSFATALVAPLLFFLIFLVLRIVTWLVYFIVMLIVGGKLREKDKTSKAKGWRALALGIVQGLLIFFVLMTPIYAYLNVAIPIAKAALVEEEAQPVVNETVEPQATQKLLSYAQNNGFLAVSDKVDTQAIQKLMDDMKNNFFFAAYGKLGGNLTCDFLMGFTTGGEKTTITKEINAISALVTEAMKLKDIKGIESLDEEKAVVIGNLVASVSESKMMQTVVGELVYAFTDAWKNNQPVLGTERPKLDSTVEPIFNAILEDFNKDARTPGQIDADLKTLGEMIKIMAKSDLLKEIAGENPDSDKLIETLAQGSLIKDLIATLGKNSTLKNLIPEVANVGMRALGETVLNLPENAREIFEQYIQQITDAVNEVLAAEATYEEKVDLLAAKMLQAIDECGVEFELDEAVAKLYSDAILSDIRDAGLTQITTDDVRDFFELVADELEEGSGESTAPLAARFGAGEKTYRGTLYGNKSKSEIEGSAVIKLVAVTKEIAKASEEATDEQAFQNKMSQISEQFGIVVDLSNLSKDAFTKENLKGTSLLKEDTFPTALVTVESLLIDTKKVSDNLNENTIDAEAEKIGKIFNTALKIKDAFQNSSEGFNLETLNGIAADLGAVLDSIDSTETFEGKTALVITAVFQKDEVVESMDMDIRTATEIAKAATDSVNGVKPDYSATMESVSTGASIAQKLSDPEGKITEDDVEDLLRTITPQTANMLKIYLTDERVNNFGIPNYTTNAAARILRALFDEMSDKEKYTDYSGETTAMLKIFEAARAAGSSSEANRLFNSGDEVGHLKLTAAETVELVMNANMVRNAFVAAIYVDGQIDPTMVNPYGLHIPTDGSDYQECEAAIEAYYIAHPESKTFLKAFAAFFGVEASFLN